MSNLTISMDDRLIKAARVQAIQQGTSLSAKIRDFVAQFVAAGTPVPSYTPVKFEPSAAAHDLLRMMQDVRDEIAANQLSAGAQPLNAAPFRPSLREQLYEGDYRARDRIESNAQVNTRPGDAPA